MSAAATVNLYLHTHWDREWYLPYETYRAQLLSVVKQIIAKLKNGDLPNFLLDGQACVLQDVLEIEPDLAEPIRALMKSKRGGEPTQSVAEVSTQVGTSVKRSRRRLGPTSRGAAASRTRLRAVFSSSTQ